MDEPTGTRFYELAGIALSVAQMWVYWNLFQDYKKKLEEMADKLEGFAEKDKAQYMKYRDLDDAYRGLYDAYADPRDAALNSYQVCEVDILRSKGSAFRVFGELIRTTRQTNNGYTPLAMVRYVGQHAPAVVTASANARAMTHHNEHKRKNDDLLNRWKLRIAVPLEQEGNHVDFRPITQSFAQTFARAGQGFNSAGVAFGNALYQYLRK